VSRGAEVLQLLYNRLDRKAEATLFPIAQRDNLGVLARVPLASGLLTGKYTSADVFPAADVRSTFDRDNLRQMLTQIETIKHTEVPNDVPLAQWALAWCLKHPAVTCVIPGCKDAAQVRFNAHAGDLAPPL
jgi:aryl-alcohol dehydrogenase-like predicted oxidoreductase